MIIYYFCVKERKELKFMTAKEIVGQSTINALFKWLAKTEPDDGHIIKDILSIALSTVNEDALEYEDYERLNTLKDTLAKLENGEYNILPLN